MAASIRVRTAVEDGVMTLKALIRHPMETGARKDEWDRLIPAHYIQKVVCEHNGRPVLTCYWGTGIARNPYLSFRIEKARRGDVVRLWWVDNQGASEAVSVVVGESELSSHGDNEGAPSAPPP